MGIPCPKEKKKLPKISTVRNKADSYITPLAKLLNPRCLLCNGVTQVGHHFIKKSESTRLRYEESNIIPLCNSCHLALHSHEGLYSARIVSIMGLEWFSNLERLKRELVKSDVHYFIYHRDRLARIIEQKTTE